MWSFPPEISPSSPTQPTRRVLGLAGLPDVDAVIYRLAGVFNEAAGYGQKDETFHALDALPRWQGDLVRIGDKDLATHVLRAEVLRRRRNPHRGHARAVPKVQLSPSGAESTIR